MALREFRDAHGVRWMVWDTIPEMSDRRRQDLGPPSGIERRRENLGPRAAVAADYEEGWLSFESDAERRRLVPRPEGWELLTDAELEELCARAIVVSPLRHLP